MLIQESFHRFAGRLSPLYSEREARQVTRIVFEKVTGYTRLDILTRPETAISPDTGLELEQKLLQLLEGRPLQYVIGEAWFCDFPLKVTEGVLIPRPETEELVAWVLEDLKGGVISFQRESSALLDAGTGSGCMAIALKKKLPGWNVIALDHSPEALRIARENAALNQVTLEWIEADLLAPGLTDGLPALDVIVSNPPYIPLKEKAGMQPQVTRYEPPGALFVPDEDPLVFYRALLGHARLVFDPEGWVYAEIHEDLGEKTAALFREGGATEVLLRRDMNGRDRMIRARIQGASALK